jgi:hypothetical protein
MAWTEKRIKTLQEVLGGMRVIKYFGWEVSYPTLTSKHLSRLLPGALHEKNSGIPKQRDEVRPKLL